VAAILLAPERQALKITDNPVWITGVGYSQEAYYLGDRNLYESKSMELAGKTAFESAGIKDPKSEIDVAELFEAYAHEELILSEALGLAEKGKGASINSEINGDISINPSGGAIGGNPPCATGLIRVIEAAKLLLQVKLVCVLKIIFYLYWREVIKDGETSSYSIGRF